MRTWICLVAASILGTAPVLAAEQFDRKAELARLKAHYVGKVVTVKTDLPRTDGGFVFINDGQLDTIGLAKSLQGSSSLGVEAGGVGIPKGSDVVIRDIKLKPKYAQFYLGTSLASTIFSQQRRLHFPIGCLLCSSSSCLQVLRSA